MYMIGFMYIFKQFPRKIPFWTMNAPTDPQITLINIIFGHIHTRTNIDRQRVWINEHSYVRLGISAKLFNFRYCCCYCWWYYWYLAPTLLYSLYIPRLLLLLLKYSSSPCTLTTKLCTSMDVSCSNSIAIRTTSRSHIWCCGKWFIVYWDTLSKEFVSLRSRIKSEIFHLSVNWPNSWCAYVHLKCWTYTYGQIKEVVDSKIVPYICINSIWLRAYKWGIDMELPLHYINVHTQTDTYLSLWKCKWPPEAMNMRAPKLCNFCCFAVLCSHICCCCCFICVHFAYT